MNMEEGVKIKAVCVYFEQDDFRRLLQSHELAIPLGEIPLFKLAGLQYAVICYGHIPSWVAKVREVLLPEREGGLVCARVSEVRSLSWGNPEVPKAFRDHPLEKMKPAICEFPDETFFNLGEIVQLQPGLHQHGFLSLERAVEQLAEAYRVDPSQVKISISAKK
ncbi:hypothetical protein [Pseudomonas sp. TWRC1-2]|uniref:hypothetical protein n=1 Tax=Pseudomonas sp. TWRC1-2 TaxID=2804628 RepID=UPI003CF371C0